VSRQPAYSETIIAVDDPLNTPEDTKTFVAFAAGKRVTILSRGGHLGYVCQEWTKNKLMTLFDGTK